VVAALVALIIICIVAVPGERHSSAFRGRRRYAGGRVFETYSAPVPRFRRGAACTWSPSWSADRPP
jgi:hypothetical protein